MILTVVIWLCAAVFLIVPIFHLFRSASDGDLDMSTAVVLAFILISLGVLTAFSAGQPQSFGLLLAMLAAGVAAPWAGEWYTRTLHRQIDDEQIRKYRAAIDRDPNNSGAHALLAEAYARHHRYAEAVTHYETALAISPDPDSNPHFAKWTRHLRDAHAAGASGPKHTRKVSG